MFASAASTVISTAPLFAAQTLILNRFALVIFVTMVISLMYVVMFMTPMLAMFGPGHDVHAHKDLMKKKDLPLEKTIRETLLHSIAVRLLLIVVVTIVVFVRPPFLPQIRIHNSGSVVFVEAVGPKYRPTSCPPCSIISAFPEPVRMLTFSAYVIVMHVSLPDNQSSQREFLNDSNLLELNSNALFKPSGN